MKRSVITGIVCCFTIIFMTATLWTADQDKPKTPEQQAWEKVDSLSKQSVQDFLKEFPVGELAKQAKIAVELQDKLASIKGGKTKGAFTISFAVLGERWKDWQQRNPDKGIVGHFVKKGEKFNTLGLFTPDPLSGGKTDVTFSFDARGIPTSPTGDGSIIAFRTGGIKFELFKGLVFETPADEPIYFAVISGKGLVHLKGAGKVTLPDGKATGLK